VADSETIDDHEEEAGELQESTVKLQFVSPSAANEAKATSQSKDSELTARTASDSFDSEEQIETTLTETGLVETKCVVVQNSDYRSGSEDLKHSTTDDTSSSDDEEQEDLIESSKRLLRMADKRLQYQQHNDEIKSLKYQVDTMRTTAEAMTEQLRRAIETKCDLVLSQTEMERCHEQDLIAKDDELHDMKLYIHQLKEAQAFNELNFMNEIASLSKNVSDMSTKHESEIVEKDFQIDQLEAKMKSRKTESVRGNSSRTAFRSRFVENISLSSLSDAPSVPSVQCA
jgi:hypothetical protein